MTKPKSIIKVEKADLRVAAKAAKADAVTPLRWAAKLSKLADQPPVAALCAGVVAVGALRGDMRLARTGLRMGAAFALATLGKAMVKSAVDRTRPREAAKKGYASGKGKHNEGPLNSFPSGHTANAVALARAITREYPGAAFPAYTVAALTGAALMTRGAHFASDVAAGGSIGAAAEAVTAPIFNYLGERRL